MDSKVQEELEAIAEKYDVGVDDLSAQFERYREETESNMVFPDEEKVSGIALRRIEAEYLSETRLQGGGEWVEVLAYGHDRIRRWGENNDDVEERDVLIANGVVIPEDGPIGRGVFIMDELHEVDLGNAKERFHTLNTFSGVFRVAESDNVTDGYVLNSTTDTEFEDETEDLPEDIVDKRELLHKFSEKVELGTITEGLSMGEMVNGVQRAVDFGIDLKWVDGYVVDAYKEDDGSFAVYTVHDDSHGGEEELEGTALDDEGGRTIGLTCWSPNEFMEYGIGSSCEFYGVVTENNDGKIVMNLRGVVPISPRPFEQDSAEDDDDVETFQIA